MRDKDLVAKLRAIPLIDPIWKHQQSIREAADQIERLRKQLTELGIELGTKP